MFLFTFSIMGCHPLFTLWEFVLRKKFNIVAFFVCLLCGILVFTFPILTFCPLFNLWDFVQILLVWLV